MQGGEPMRLFKRKEKAIKSEQKFYFLLGQLRNKDLIKKEVMTSYLVHDFLFIKDYKLL